MGSQSNLRSRRRGRIPAAALRARNLALVILAALVLSCSLKSEEQRLSEAQALLQQRNILGAIIAFKDFIKRYPDSELVTTARFGLASCYFFDRDFTSSRRVLDLIIDETGGRTNQAGFEASILKVQTYSAQQRPAEALDEALLTSDSLRVATPRAKSDFMMGVAQLLVVNDRKEEAVGVYESILQEESETRQKQAQHLFVLNALSALYLEDGNIDGALAIYSEYLEKNPESDLKAEVYKGLAKLQKSEGQEAAADENFDKAEAILQETLETTLGADEKSVLLLGLADIRIHRDRIAEAKDLYRKILDDYPMGRYRSAAMRLLSESLFKEGDVESALDLLAQIVESYPITKEAQMAIERAQEMKASRIGVESGAIPGPFRPQPPPEAENEEAPSAPQDNPAP